MKKQAGEQNQIANSAFAHAHALAQHPLSPIMKAGVYPLAFPTAAAFPY